MHPMKPLEGILLVDKSDGSTSFQIVSLLRKLTKIQKIGHAGTLDPFATGLMIMLVGKNYTKKSDTFLNLHKTYRATLTLGSSTDTFDREGKLTETSDYIPSLEEIEKALSSFQGKILQTPPMFSAKKVQGKKLYELARKGISIERKPVLVEVKIELLSYSYPELEIQVDCSKGTYIRSLAHDLGERLTSKAHLSKLNRTKIGSFSLNESISQSLLKNLEFDLSPYLRSAV